MLDNPTTFKRVAFTVAFTAVCIGLGFYLATGFEMPAQLNASTIQSARQILAPNLPASLPLIDEEGSSPFVKVAERVKPVVVNISAEKEISGHPSVPFDLFDWGPFWGDPPDDSRRRRVPHVTSGGSGIIIDEDGFILTNNHVISEATDIRVKFADESEHPAEVIGTDPETDVALIKVNQKIPADMVAKLGDSDQIRIGEWALAVGNPFGLDWTVTVGVISARGRSNLAIGGGNGPSYQNFIQTDASINFGNSGGPLLNIRGEVIGVNTAINARGQGIGFAIPINLARKVTAQLREKGEVQRGYLGVVPREVDDVTREAIGLDPDIEGVFIDSVQPETPAEDGGLKGGEVVTSIEGVPVRSVTDFRFRIADFPPGSKVSMTAWKDGESREYEFKLGDRSEFITVASANRPTREKDWLGIRVVPVDSRAQDRLGLDDKRGALVTAVAPDMPAAGLLEPGDVIVEVGGIEVDTIEDYNRAAEELKDRTRAIPFWVIRNGRRTFVPIRPEAA